jgi:hypothetical protein
MRRKVEIWDFLWSGIQLWREIADPYCGCAAGIEIACLDDRPGRLEGTIGLVGGEESLKCFREGRRW